MDNKAAAPADKAPSPSPSTAPKQDAASADPPASAQLKPESDGALFVVPLPDDYGAFLQDLVRMLTVQIVVQVMVALQTSQASLLDGNFFALLLYVALGVAAYWLIVKRVLRFA